MSTEHLNYLDWDAIANIDRTDPVTTLNSTERRARDHKAQRDRQARTIPRPDNTVDITWQDAAACRTKGTSLFYPPAQEREPGRIHRETRARQLCNTCPVREPCLEYAMVHLEAGFWGGVSENDRARMRRNTRESVPELATKETQ